MRMELYTFTHAKKRELEIIDKIRFLLKFITHFCTTRIVWIWCDARTTHRIAELLDHCIISKSCSNFRSRAFPPYIMMSFIYRRRRIRRKYNASHYRSIYVRLRQYRNSTHTSQCTNMYVWVYLICLSPRARVLSLSLISFKCIFDISLFNQTHRDEEIEGKQMMGHLHLWLLQKPVNHVQQ